VSGTSLARGKWQALSPERAPVQFFLLYNPQQHFQQNPDKQKSAVLTFAKWSLLVSGFLFFIFDLLDFKTEPRKIRGRRLKGKKKKKWSPLSAPSWKVGSLNGDSDQLGYR